MNRPTHDVFQVNSGYAPASQDHNPTLEELKWYKQKSASYYRLRAFAIKLSAAPVLICIILGLSIIFSPYGPTLIFLQIIFIIGLAVIAIELALIVLMWPILAPINAISNRLSLTQKATAAKVIIAIGFLLLLFLPLFLPLSYWYWTDIIYFVGLLSWVVGRRLLAWPDQTIGERYRAYYSFAAPHLGEPVPATDLQDSALPPPHKTLIDIFLNMFIRLLMKLLGTAHNSERTAKLERGRQEQVFSTISEKEFDEFCYYVLAPQVNKFESTRLRSNTFGRLTFGLAYLLKTILVCLTPVAIVIYGTTVGFIPNDENGVTLFYTFTLIWLIGLLAIVSIGDRYSNKLKRQRKKNYAMALVGVGIVYVLFSGAIYWQTASVAISAISLLFGLILLALALILQDDESQYAMLYKEQLIPQVLRLFGTGLTFTAEPDISSQRLAESKLFEEPDRIKAKGEISGTIDGIAHTITEISTTKFKGLLYTATYPKNFSGQLHLYPKGYTIKGYSTAAGNSRWLPRFGAKKSEPLPKQILADDEAFEHLFRIHGHHPQGDDAILPPKLRVRLLELQRILPKFAMTISGNTVYLAVWDSSKIFEVPTKHAAMNYTTVQNLVVTLEKIVAITDYLNVQQN